MENLDVFTLFFCIGAAISAVVAIAAYTLRKMADGAHLVLDWLEKRDCKSR